MKTIGSALANPPPNADVQLTAPQVVAYHALRRHVATLSGDAEMLANLGERSIADELNALAGVLDALSAKYLAEVQRKVIVPSGVVVQ